jgi:hypothetical protein
LLLALDFFIFEHSLLLGFNDDLAHKVYKAQLLIYIQEFMFLSLFYLNCSVELGTPASQSSSHLLGPTFADGPPLLSLYAVKIKGNSTARCGGSKPPGQKISKTLAQKQGWHVPAIPAT